VPHEVNAAMLHGWHGHNGVSLGNPRLGFVCTGMITSGAPGLEGYYYEHDRALAPEERVRFVDGEHMPRFDPVKAPRLDVATWPAARLHKVYRSYAMEYVRSLLPTLDGLLGAAGVREEVGRAARLVGLQLFDGCAAQLGLCLDKPSPAGFASCLADLQRAQGEDVSVEGAHVVQRGWKLMRGVDLGSETSAMAAFEAWNALWVGALAAYDRFLALDTTREPGGTLITWHVRAA
jgi:hypothetical protein